MLHMCLKGILCAAVLVTGTAMPAGLWVVVPGGTVYILFVGVPGLYTYEHAHKIGL